MDGEEPRQLFRFVVVSVAAGLLAYGFLQVIGRQSWELWFITGVVMLVGVFLQPDLAPFENNSRGGKGNDVSDTENGLPPLG